MPDGFLRHLSEGMDIPTLRCLLFRFLEELLKKTNHSRLSPDPTIEITRSVAPGILFKEVHISR